jgi:GNAT superfamily N-acetyltransferase
MSSEMQFEMVVADNPPPEEREAILEPLRAFNESRAGPSGYRTLAVLLRDPEGGKTIGGLWGRLSYGWLHIDMLFVPEKLRGERVGTRLVHQAEAFALEHGQIGAWVDTHEFQALGFYQKLGYEVFGVLPDHPRGQRHFFLQRRFQQA